MITRLLYFIFVGWGLAGLIRLVIVSYFSNFPIYYKSLPGLKHALSVVSSKTRRQSLPSLTVGLAVGVAGAKLLAVILAPSSSIIYYNHRIY